MTDKLNLPEEICPGTPEYSPCADWRVNGWILAAALTSGATDILFPGVVMQWPVAGRAAIVIVQFLAIVLWARSLAHWVSGMDELHRQLVQKSVLFATGATLFTTMLWHRLEAADLFVFGKYAVQAHHNAGGNILTAVHVFLLLTLFYFISYHVLRRRYQ